MRIWSVSNWREWRIASSIAPDSPSHRARSSGSRANPEHQVRGSECHRRGVAATDRLPDQPLPTSRASEPWRFGWQASAGVDTEHFRFVTEQLIEPVAASAARPNLPSAVALAPLIANLDLSCRVIRQRGPRWATTCRAAYLLGSLASSEQMSFTASSQRSDGAMNPSA